MELLTAAQMRAIEQTAIASGEVTGLELMERAGRGVVEAIFEEWPKLATSPGRAVVLCGPGNNGGDGFVVARLLKGQRWDVEVFLYGDEAKLPPDAAENCRRWREMGEVRELSSPILSSADKSCITEAAYSNSGTQLLIDALFGIGLSRPLTGLKEFLKLQDLYVTFDDLMPLKTIAIDFPSGICSNSGRCLEIDIAEDWSPSAVQADLTVTFHRPKVGHVVGDGALYCGKLAIKPIGLGPSEKEPKPVNFVVDPSGFGKGAAGHKYSHGHALVLSGGVGKGGAARLAARGALRIGAGLVTVGAPPSALIENAAQLNAIMLALIEGAEGLIEVLQDDRINVIVLGPGLGVSEHTRDLTLAALECERSAVLDADALSSFAEAPETLFKATRGRNVVLTPHMGEFRRLFPDIAETLSAPAEKGPAFSKVDAACEAARRAGCVVLLKGPDTVVAGPEGGASVVSAAYERACPWLATAGSGDVLAGFIGGLMARGFPPETAAETGSWLHQECAREFGPGLIAEDLPETLPTVFRKLGL